MNRRVIALLSAGHLMADFYAGALPALLPVFQTAYGLTYSGVAVISAVSHLTASVSQPAMGYFIDRVTRRGILPLACALAAVGISATGLAPSFGALLALVVLGGLGVAAYHPPAYKLAARHSGARRATGTSFFSIGGNLGIASGPLIATAVVLRYGAGGTWLLAVPGVLMALVLARFAPSERGAPRRQSRNDADSPASGSDARRPRQSSDRTRPLSRARPPSPAKRGTSLRGEAGPGFAEPGGSSTWRRQTASEGAGAPAGGGRLTSRSRLLPLAVLTAIVVVRSATSVAVPAFLPLYYVRDLGISMGEASQALSLFLFSGAVGTLIGGYSADRWGRLRWLFLSQLPVTPALLWFLQSAGTPAAVPALAVGGGALISSFGVTVVMAQELWPENQGMASGIMVGFAFGVGGMLMPLLGAIGDSYSLGTTLALVALMPLAAVALTALLAIQLRGLAA